MEKYTKEGEWLTDIVLGIFRLNGQILAMGDGLSRPFGLTSSRWQVLGAVDGAPRTVSGIARVMGLQRQSVQRTVDILVGEGFVRLLDNPEDRRAKLVEQTAKGHSAFLAVSEAYTKWANRMADHFQSEDLRHTRDQLSQFLDLLEKEGY